jgi:hypothetical protein
MEKKVCNSCGEEKNLLDFHKGKTKDGYQYKCKVCKKKYSEINVEKENNRKRTWAKNNQKKVKESKKKYYSNNKEKELFRNNEYTNIRKKTDIIYKLACISRTRLINFLEVKKITKKNNTFNYIGCTPLFLKKYLEDQFIDGMSWDNHGKWHIDHIIPLASAETEEDIYRLSHYTNLQPLWAEDNWRKNSKIL